MVKYIDDEKILELYKQGMKHKDIALKLNYGKSTVTAHLLRMGYKTLIPIDKDIVLELYGQNFTDKEIADKLNCTRANITHYLNSIGITNRKNKINNIQLRNKISNSLKGRYIGKDNPNYKGSLNEKMLARGMFKTISKELIRNNNYTCHNCGKRGGDLVTHHIKPFKIILYDFINTIYDGNIDTFYEQLSNYDDFTNKNNMVVLCRDCHYKVHYTDNHELSPYRWESATTIESE